jgi:hypothetical protein
MSKKLWANASSSPGASMSQSTTIFDQNHSRDLSDYRHIPDQAPPVSIKVGTVTITLLAPLIRVLAVSAAAEDFQAINDNGLNQQ